MRHGPAELRYASGKPKARGAYLEGTQHGEWVQYYEDGTVWVRQHFDRGQLEGAEQAFFPNRVLQYEVSHAAGLATGALVRNDAAGRKLEEGRFDGGLPAGTWTTFDPWSGIARLIRTYFEGARCSHATYHDEGGNTPFVRRGSWHGSSVTGGDHCQAVWKARSP